MPTTTRADSTTNGLTQFNDTVAGYGYDNAKQAGLTRIFRKRHATGARLYPGQKREPDRGHGDWCVRSGRYGAERQLYLHHDGKRMASLGLNGPYLRPRRSAPQPGIYGLHLRPRTSPDRKRGIELFSTTGPTAGSRQRGHGYEEIRLRCLREPPRRKKTGAATILKYFIYGKGLLAWVDAGTGAVYCYHFDGTATP